MTTVWLCEPRSHGRRKAASLLPGRPPSAHIPHRSASPALCPCGHAASFRRRASSFVRGVWSSAALLPAAVLCERGRRMRRAVRRARAWCCPVAAAAAPVACALRLSRCLAKALRRVRERWLRAWCARWVLGRGAVGLLS